MLTLWKRYALLIKTNKSNIDCQHGQSNSSEYIIEIFNYQKNIQNLYFMLILGHS